MSYLTPEKLEVGYSLTGNAAIAVIVVRNSPDLDEFRPTKQLLYG